MAVLITKSQAIRASVNNPMAAYSRVVLVQLIVDAGVGSDSAGTTPPLGNRVRLLGVDIWLQPVAQGGFIEGAVKVKTGSGVKTPVSVISLEWATVMDESQLLKLGFLVFCCVQHYHFDMNRLYVGESQRFAVYSTNLSNTKYSILGAFQISEE
ncbi:hypothetical protein ES703_34741 [subsurface metagenome]